MKGFKKFKKNSVISNAIAMAAAGVGAAGADWALKKIDIIPGDWDDQIVAAVKVVGGALLGSMTDSNTLYGIPKAVGDGIATVGAYKLAESFLPDVETKESAAAAAGLPEGTIGRLRMGQRGFRKGIKGVNGAAFMQD